MYVYNNHGPVVRLIWLCLAMVWWIAARFGLVRRPAVVTLCYHGVTAGQRQRFANQMKTLAGRAVSPNAADPYRRRRFARPEVCVTFDDGFANLLEHALPATRELGIPVTVFLVMGNLGSLPRWDMEYEQPDAAQMTMSESQVTQAATDSLCRFASHSLTHARLTAIPLSQAKRELADSRAQLAQLLGRDVDDFAFPYGACSGQLIAEVFASGYRRVHTLRPMGKGTDSDRGRVVARMKMSPDAWLLEYRLTVGGAYEWLWTVRRALNHLVSMVTPKVSTEGPLLPSKATGG